MWYKGAQDVKSWGQTASILGVAVTSGSFLYALHLLFKTESVEKRQRIIRDYSHGTAFPRLAITPLVKSDMISFAGILQRLSAHLLSRSPFGKVRLRSPNHCRLSTIPGAWERITYQYRQWPGRDAEQLGIILIQTSVLGDIKQIGDLLAEGASTATKDRNGETALHIACKQRNVNIIKALIAGGAALEIESKDGWTALHFAVSGGPVEVLKCFLDLDINTSPQAKNGQTPFHLAIEGGNLELLHVMLEMKPHLDLGDKTGLTPLHLASELQDPDPTLLLLVTGANPNLKDKRGYSPLHIDILCGKNDLVGGIANPGSQYMHGWTPLHYAMTCEDEDPKLVSLLLAIKGDPNCREQHGLTPLHVASVVSRLVQARALIREQHAEVNA